MANYAGDVDASETWERLANEPNSFLIDVRTIAEWTYVGMPDLSSVSKSVILIEWQQYPHMGVNPDFAHSVASAITENGGDQSTEVYFICRSGVRSMAAAAALTSIGFENCFNVVGGFEGPPDNEQQRGNIDGWKAKELPWSQK